MCAARLCSIHDSITLKDFLKKLPAGRELPGTQHRKGVNNLPHISKGRISLAAAAFHGCKTLLD